MIEAIPYLISGMIFGLAAGVSPGPLLTLVISETIRHSKREGIAVACAPVITDLPIVMVSVFILKELSGSDTILGIISISGALFIAYLAYESITVRGIEIDQESSGARSLRKGVIANFLSPHPYLFWIAVGAPTVLKAYTVNFTSAVFFISGFYLLLIGSKIITALIVDRSRAFLKSSAYINIIRLLGLILLFFSAIFILDGLKLLGVL